jgi:hypothetical protein
MKKNELLGLAILVITIFLPYSEVNYAKLESISNDSFWVSSQPLEGSVMNYQYSRAVKARVNPFGVVNS